MGTSSWAPGRFILDGARETLVLLGIIVLQSDLQFDGFCELALLGVVGVGEHGGYTLVQQLSGQLATNTRYIFSCFW